MPVKQPAKRSTQQPAKQPDRAELTAARRDMQRTLLNYYAEPEPALSDADFDALKTRIAALEAEHPQWREWDSGAMHVTAPAAEAFPTRPHRTPMLSLGNAYSLEELREWQESLLRLVPDQRPAYVAELKVDGVAIAVRYEQGRLTSAVTRGDGTSGEEVTPNVKTIRSLPHNLPEPLTMEVRGEVYYPFLSFERMNRHRERIGEPIFKNPRNAAAGTLRTLDTSEVGARGLELMVYALASESPHPTHWATLGWLKELGLPVSGQTAACADLEEVEAFYTHWESRRDELPFQIDGIVVKVDGLALREEIGATARSPRWAVAVKYATEQAETRLLDVEVGVGRTGALTPVAILEPVELGGTTVSRATLHNYDQVRRLGLMFGDTVLVEKGGEIIPKIVGVDKTQRTGKQRPVKPPGKCPSCGAPPVRDEGEVDLRCVNPLCPAQQAERIRHFVSLGAMDIESIGPALIEQLLREELLSSVADLYRLEAEQLEQLERMGEKSARNVTAAIDASRTRPLDKLVFALGIRFVGARTARILAERFGTLEALRAADVEELEGVDEIGSVIAASVHEYFREPNRIELLEQLLALGVDPQPVQPAGGEARILSGRTIVLTGTLSEPRGRWKARLEAAGGTVTGSVSKNTDYVLAGVNPGSKLAAAQKLDVPVLDEEEMRQLLETA
ncbi:MAG: NAD-dependent DNA ligase LigA [SAR324 cluster bacterium]|nr:NAD-dependent DNA ligase LigA [SAR324 cluster bacterium]